MTIRQPQGDYQVLCRDGTTEYDTPDKILRNDICNGIGTQQEVVCVSTSGGYLPTSTKGGRSFGQPIWEQDCNTATVAARYGAVCGNANGFGPFRIKDGVQLGQMSSLQACVAATLGARRGVICTGASGQTFLTDIATGRRYGDRLNAADCQDVLNAVKYETMCSMQGNQYVMTNILTGQLFGEGRSKSDCLEASAAAAPHAVCIGRGNEWVVTRGGDGKELGDPMPLNDCTTITQSVREESLCSRRSGLFFPTSITNAMTFGGVGDSRDSCLDAVKSANFGVICSHLNGAGYVPTRMKDGFSLGQPMAASACTAATMAIQRDMICTFKDGQYFPTRIEDGTALGVGATLTNCLRAVANGAIPSH